MERKPSGNGNTLRDYRLDKVEELIIKHDDRIKLVENAILASASGDLWNKYLKVGSVITVALGTLAGVIYAIVR